MRGKPPGRLLKRWNDWSAGIGHLVDDGRTPGMYYAAGLLGLRGELRPAPFKNTVTVGIDSAHHYQYFFEEALSNQTPVHDADSSGEDDAASTLTVAHTVASQPNRILLVWVSWDSLVAPPTVTYNGTSMTQVTNVGHGTDSIITALYYLLEPSTGTNDIVATISGSRNMVLIGTSFYKVSQSVPYHAVENSTGTGTNIAVTGISSASDEIMLLGSATDTNTTITKDGAETLIKTEQTVGNNVRATASYKAGSQSGSMTHTAGISCNNVKITVALIGASGANRPGYLYAMRGGAAGSTPCQLEKIDLFNNSFATLESGSHELTSLLKAGQPTRYQSFWWLPTGASKDPRKLTVAEGDVSADTLAAETSGQGGDHLGNLNGQMIEGAEGSGYAILKVDGTPTTDADWGSYFPVGDKNERPAAISGLSGASFVLTPEGLFSFNSKARSGLVFEDFRSWRNSFDTIPMPAWKGGFFISHPTGLQFYTPDDLPVHVGVGSKSRGLPAAGVTEFTRGRYMGVHAIGEFVWAIYQPDVSSTTAQIQCGYTQTGDPTDLTWQVVATTTLNDAQHLLGCFVSAQSQPLSSGYATPVCWWGDGTDLAYIVLDPQAGPFRARADTHKVNISADAYMSELRFTEPVDLTGIVVHTSADMVSGDEYQISLIANGYGDDVNVGAPVKGSGTRHVRELNREHVTSLVLHVKWTASSTADRVPPPIQAIELFGKPSVGLVGEE